MGARLIGPGKLALTSTGRVALLSSVAGGNSSAAGSPTTMALIDFAPSLASVQPIVQRTAGTTTGKVPVLYSFTGSAPAMPQARVVTKASGAVVLAWTTLQSIVNATSTGQGTLPGVPQGSGYLLQLRDGLKPANAQATSAGSAAWGVGAIFVFAGQSNMISVMSSNYTNIVPGTNQNEYSYFVGGNVNGGIFDDAGWHAPSNGSNGPTGDGSGGNTATGNICMFLRVVSAALATKYGAPVPVGIVPWAFNANSITSFLPGATNFTHRFLSSGSANGVIGFASPGNIYAGDFEGVLWHQGEADGGFTPAQYQADLLTLYQGFLSYVTPFGRGAATLLFAPAVLGSYSPSVEPTIENVRQGVGNFEVYAKANGYPEVQIGFTSIDLSTASGDGLHFSGSGDQKTAMARCIQTVLLFLGASANGPSGAPFSGRGATISTTIARNGLAVTLSIVHEGGAALTVPTSGSAPTGFYANTAADFSGSYVIPVVALANGNTQVQLTFPAGTTFPVYLKYLGGKIGNTTVDASGYTDSCNPNFSNCLYDNASYPTGTTGTDIEARGLPVLPSLGAIKIS